MPPRYTAAPCPQVICQTRLNFYSAFQIHLQRKTALPTHGVPTLRHKLPALVARTWRSALCSPPRKALCGELMESPIEMLHRGSGQPTRSSPRLSRTGRPAAGRAAERRRRGVLRGSGAEGQRNRRGETGSQLCR